MKLNKIATTISSKLGRTGLKFKKASPEICFAIGLAGVVVSAVWACTKAAETTEVLEQHNKELDEIKEYAPEAEKNKEIAKTYVETGKRFVSIYWKPALTGVISIALLSKAHVGLKNLGAGYMAAYAAEANRFNRYRENVIARYGEQEDADFMHGYRICNVVDQDVNEETGEIIENKKSIQVFDTPKDGSEYGRWFAEGCSRQFEKNDYAHNISFIRMQETYFNQMLNSRGHVFLNEVYDALGFDRTPAGAVVGWIKDGDGDNYIDFGMSEDIWTLNGETFNTIDYDPTDIKFFQRGFWLDFNIDGLIYDKI